MDFHCDWPKIAPSYLGQQVCTTSYTCDWNDHLLSPILVKECQVSEWIILVTFYSESPNMLKRHRLPVV